MDQLPKNIKTNPHETVDVSPDIVDRKSLLVDGQAGTINFNDGAVQNKDLYVKG